MLVLSKLQIDYFSDPGNLSYKVLESFRVGTVKPMFFASLTTSGFQLNHF